MKLIRRCIKKYSYSRLKSVSGSFLLTTLIANDSLRWVPAAGGIVSPLTSQANRACPALNTINQLSHVFNCLSITNLKIILK